MLKVPAQPVPEPSPMDMPPQGFDPMQEGDPSMAEADPSMGGMDMGQQPMDFNPTPNGADQGFNPFDSNFDPGVEADEETDPKRFIQQLTGKLSQSLRSYNQSLPQPDTDLSKYVAGMILKQTADGIPQDEMGELIKNAEEDEKDGDSLGESVRHEDVLNISDDTDEQAQSTEKPRNSKRDSFTTRAFTSPRFI